MKPGCSDQGFAARCTYQRTGAAAGGDEDATKDAIAAVKLYNRDMESAKKLDAHRQALFEADRSKEVGVRENLPGRGVEERTPETRHCSLPSSSFVIITHWQDGTLLVHLIIASR